MTLKVHIQFQLRDYARAFLLEAVDEGVLISEGEELPQTADFEVLVTGHLQSDHITASPNLKMLVVPWAGISSETRDLMSSFPQVAVHNLHHNAAPTAEMALTLMFAAAKRIVPFDNALRSNNWMPRYQENPSILLHGKTVLVLGFGAIGQRVARVCRALNMNVLAVRRQAPPGGYMQDGVQVHGINDLLTLLPQVDILMVTLPGTEETEGLIAERELSLMRKGGILVNVGRGSVVDQKALYNALKDGTLGAAGLDVWYNYPSDEESRKNTPPSDFPFAELDNVVMSPHRGGDGGTRDVERLRMNALAELLNAALHGQTVPNRVDLQSGY